MRPKSSKVKYNMFLEREARAEPKSTRALLSSKAFDVAFRESPEDQRKGTLITQYLYSHVCSCGCVEVDFVKYIFVA